MTDSSFSPSQVVLSESKDGRQIAIVGTSASTATLLHKGSESISGEVWEVLTIEAVSPDGTAQPITILCGGVDVSDQCTQTIAVGSGRNIIVLKHRARRGLEWKAFCTGGANLVNVYGEVGVLRDRETV